MLRRHSELLSSLSSANPRDFQPSQIAVSEQNPHWGEEQQMTLSKLFLLHKATASELKQWTFKAEGAEVREHGHHPSCQALGSLCPGMQGQWMLNQTHVQPTGGTLGRNFHLSWTPMPGGRWTSHHVQLERAGGKGAERVSVLLSLCTAIQPSFLG